MIKSVHTAEVRDAALGGNARPAKEHDAAAFGNDLFQCLYHNKKRPFRCGNICVSIVLSITQTHRKGSATLNVWYVNSILGTFRLEEENDAICGLTLCPDGVPELEPLPRKVCETPLLQEAEEQLNEYFAGARREFDLPLAPRAPLPESGLGRDEQDPLR